MTYFAALETPHDSRLNARRMKMALSSFANGLEEAMRGNKKMPLLTGALLSLL
jgi:hypothetical protein